MSDKKHSLKIKRVAIVMGLFIAFYMGGDVAKAAEISPEKTVQQGQMQPIYITTLPDIPVMDGLIELHDEGFIFDAPEGRAAGAILFGNKVTQKEVRDYYNRIFPRLGWTAQKTGVFVRGGEQLTVEIEENQGEVVVVLELSPESDQK